MTWTVLRTAARVCLGVAAVLVAATVLPAVAGWHSYVVVSGSMEPSISPGDVVVAAPAALAVVVPGQVVVFTADDGRRVMHRVQSSAGGALVTRGDANASADSAPVLAGALLGVARLRVPAIGLPVYWAGTGQWRPLGIASAVLVLMFLTASREVDRAALTPELTPSSSAARRPAPAHRRPGGLRRGARLAAGAGGLRRLRHQPR